MESDNHLKHCLGYNICEWLISAHDGYWPCACYLLVPSLYYSNGRRRLKLVAYSLTELEIREHLLNSTVLRLEHVLIL